MTGGLNDLKLTLSQDNGKSFIDHELNCYKASKKNHSWSFAIKHVIIGSIGVGLLSASSAGTFKLWMTVNVIAITLFQTIFTCAEYKHRKTILNELDNDFQICLKTINDYRGHSCLADVFKEIQLSTPEKQFEKNYKCSHEQLTEITLTVSQIIKCADQFFNKFSSLKKKAGVFKTIDREKEGSRLEREKRFKAKQNCFNTSWLTPRLEQLKAFLDLDFKSEENLDLHSKINQALTCLDAQLKVHLNTALFKCKKHVIKQLGRV